MPHVDYTSNVIKDIVVLCIADADIQKDVLAWDELDVKNDMEVVAFVESKELAQCLGKFSILCCRCSL